MLAATDRFWRCWRRPTSRVSRAGGTRLGARGGRPARAARTLPACHGRPSARERRPFRRGRRRGDRRRRALDGDPCEGASQTFAPSPARLAGDARGDARSCAVPTPRAPSRASCCAWREIDVSAEVHLIGVGGAGMSGIARVLRGHGRRSRAATVRPPASRSCAPRASTPACGHDPAHLRADMEVIVSTAVEEDEPELAAARRRGLRVRHRADVLAEIVPSGEGICVAGAHGKTSTSALIAYVLEQCGEDPTFLVGGVVPQLGANARVGAGALRRGRGRRVGRVPRAAATASRASCSTPSSTITTTSARWTTCTRPSGGWVAELPRGGRARAARRRSTTPSRAEMRRFGAGPGEGWRALDVAPDGEGTRFVLAAPGPRRAVRCASACPARTTRSTRPPRSRCSTGRASARSAPRRRSPPSAAPLGATSAGARSAGIRFVDDYAHHPTELAATLAAARAEAAPGRLLACFQPHMPWRTRVRRRLR